MYLIVQNYISLTNVSFVFYLSRTLTNWTKYQGVSIDISENKLDLKIMRQKEVESAISF